MISSISTLARSNKKSINLLAIFAHPDDEAINCGGILALAAKENIKTYLVCLTQGEQGKKNLKISEPQLRSIRKKELLLAASILHIEKVHLLGLPDGKLFYMMVKVESIIKSLITNIKPSIIITHDPTGKSGHPDHILISMCVKKIVNTNQFPNISFYYTISNIISSSTDTLFSITPTHKISILSVIGTKYKALEAYSSQLLSIPNYFYRPVNWKTIDSEWLHLIKRDKKYFFKFKSFNAKYKKLLPNINKTIIL